MKRITPILLLITLLVGCTPKDMEPVEEETTVEETTEVTTEEIIEETTIEEVEEVPTKREFTQEEKEALTLLNRSTTPSDYVVNYKSQYACSYKWNNLYRIHPVTSNKLDITNYDKFKVTVTKGYCTIAPVTGVRTSAYITVGDKLINIPGESILYFTEDVELEMLGVIINNSERANKLSLPVYTADGIMHMDGFDPSKYTPAKFIVEGYNFSTPSDYNPSLFDIVEPSDIQLLLDGGIVLTYDSSEFTDTYYLYNEARYSQSGSDYTLYKDDQKVFEGHLPAGCRMYVDFKDYDQIKVECGVLIPCDKKGDVT